MKPFSTLCVILTLGVLVSALDEFLDCAGNDNILGLLRRCCPDDRLPNGCQCYDISDSSPFRNSAFHKPECPVDLQVTFKLFNPSVPQGQVIGYGAVGSFDAGLPTRVVAHGFTDNGDAPWMLQMKDELLKNAPMNVILVDWAAGAAGPNYYQATANTRSVGSMIARLMQGLPTPFGTFHLIGHSLGAQIMGYAGREIQRLENGAMVGRISALDPAGPNFESYGPEVRIDAADAAFVDVMHTDAEPLASAGFGMRYPVGHVDFYPNGGEHQPGCPAETLGLLSMISFEDEKDSGACSHGRACDFFTNSINKCAFRAETAGFADCRMGFHASMGSCSHVVGSMTVKDHYPVTTATDPYC